MGAFLKRMRLQRAARGRDFELNNMKKDSRAKLEFAETFAYIRRTRRLSLVWLYELLLEVVRPIAQRSSRFLPSKYA